MRREHCAGERRIGARVVLEPRDSRAHAAAGCGGFAAPPLGAGKRSQGAARVTAHEKTRAEVGEKRGVGGAVLRARHVRLRGGAESGLVGRAFATDRNREALSNPVYAEKVKAAIPMHFAGAPEDAAGAALLLASEAGRYITGATLLVDGGLGLPG